MKNKIKFKIFTCILVMALCISGFPGNVYAKDLSGYYTKDDDNNPVNGGGTLYTHAERQTYGTVSSSGLVRKVKFYVYAKYSGKKTVTSIKCSWQTGAKMRSSATMQLNTSVGSSYSFGASSSSAWQSVESTEKYWHSTNGSKVEYENSNFTIAPDVDLLGYQFWIKTTAVVKVKGGAKPTTVSCGC